MIIGSTITNQEGIITVKKFSPASRYTKYSEQVVMELNIDGEASLIKMLICPDICSKISGKKGFITYLSHVDDEGNTNPYCIKSIIDYTTYDILGSNIYKDGTCIYSSECKSKRNKKQSVA